MSRISEGATEGAGDDAREKHSSRSNAGKWDSWYEGLDVASMGAFRYGDTVTYRIAAALMADVHEVEDWGCGAGGFKRFYQGRYIGVDGSHTPFADRIVDLCNYSSCVEGIVMRHVLEHNEEWQKVLEAALRSFTRKFCLILFTPFSETTHEIAHNAAHGVDVPDLSFSRMDIEDRLVGLRWELLDNIATETGYGVEHVYLVWRDSQRAFRHSRVRGRLDSWRVEAKKSLALASAGTERVNWLKGVSERIRCRTVPRQAIYTAIFGKYDRLGDVPTGANDGGVDFICFTDDECLTHSQWQIRLVEPRYGHPRLAAKYYKALPHVVLAEYCETIWVDANFQIDDENFPREAFGYLDRANLALFLHPDRGCIYDEADFCKDMPKYVDQDVLGQVAYYKEQGYPAKAGLFACGVIARSHDRKIRKLNELWMEENIQRTYQDQLSLPYLLWKLECKPAVFRQYLWKTRWGTWQGHAHDR